MHLAVDYILYILRVCLVILFIFMYIKGSYLLRVCLVISSYIERCVFVKSVSCRCILL